MELREKREKWSLAKIRKAERMANLLKIIPTVKLVGVSGALAMENSDEDDDIDLFIITSARRLWLTRFLVTVLMELTGQRRRLQATIRSPRRSHGFRFAPACHRPRWFAVKDKICLNMFLDEDHLTVSEREKNLFTAHEVVQMKPLWWRDDACQKFLWENRWVRKFLPNSMEKVKSRKPALPSGRQKYNSHLGKDTSEVCDLPRRKAGALLGRWRNYQSTFTSEECSCAHHRGGFYKQMKPPDFLGIMEKLACWVQLKYMAKRRTTEIIESGRIMFHPLDKSDWVMKNYTQGVVSITP